MSTYPWSPTWELVNCFETIFKASSLWDLGYGKLASGGTASIYRRTQSLWDGGNSIQLLHPKMRREGGVLCGSGVTTIKALDRGLLKWNHLGEAEVRGSDRIPARAPLCFMGERWLQCGVRLLLGGAELRLCSRLETVVIYPQECHLEMNQSGVPSLGSPWLWGMVPPSGSLGWILWRVQVSSTVTWQCRQTSTPILFCKQFKQKVKFPQERDWMCHVNSW